MPAPSIASGGESVPFQSPPTTYGLRGSPASNATRTSSFTSGTNHVPLIVLGSGVAGGARSSLAYNHYSLLHTVEVALGLPTLMASDASAVPMSDLFNQLQPSSGFEVLGGSLTSGAGAFSCSAGQLGAFVLGGNGVVWWKTTNFNGWSAWTLVGGDVIGNPAAACQPSTISLDLYTQGVNLALYHRLWIGSAWNAWENLGGSLTSGPGAASCAAGSADVFVLGGDGVVWRKSFRTGTWSGWLNVGGNVMGNPAVVCEPGTSNIHLFVEGTNHVLYHKLWNGMSWGPWENLGGSLSSSPATVSCAAGTVDVFVLGGDGVMWRKSFNGTTWGGWTLIGGSWNADPGAVCQPGTTKIDLFERGGDYGLWWLELPN